MNGLGFGGLRDPSDDESVWFRRNPHVGGMADFDSGTVVLNPFSTLNEEEKTAVVKNERARLLLRQFGGAPIQLSDQQAQTTQGYSPNPQDNRDTIMARLFSGDPSGGQKTLQQATFMQVFGPLFKSMMGASR